MNIRLFFSNREFLEKSPKYNRRIDSLMEEFVQKIGRNFFSLYVDDEHSMIIVKVIAAQNNSINGYVDSFRVDHYNWHASRRSIEKTHETMFQCLDPNLSIIQYMKNETKTTKQSIERLYANDE